MRLKFFALCLLITGLYNTGFAQGPIENNSYPDKYFRYPLDLVPGTAGSFGELRPNHFHSGLDFKTDHRIGIPVHAVFDGFVSRLKIQYGGFGNAIYVTHPNGYTSVYGHLDHFNPEIAKLVRDYQYRLQSWDIDVQLSPLQMPVCKDQVIAWSGNTGGSAGPHLHFELRDSATQETINPQLFGLTINDRIPPAITAMGIYHINGAPFSEKTLRQFFAVSGAAGHYRLTHPQVFNLSGQIGFGINTYDVNNSSPNHNGVYSVQLKLDGRTVYTFSVERFAFDQTHAINAYIDYPAFLSQRRWMEKCFILPGSKISLYPQSENRGLITFNDDQIHDVEYVIKDIAGNTSTLAIKVKSSPMKDHLPVFTPIGTLFRYDKVNEFNAENIKVIIPPGNLYDDLDFTYAVLPAKPGTYSATHRLHNKFTPIHDQYDIWIKPDARIGKYADKAVIVGAASGEEGSIFEDGYVKAKAKGFGEFYIKVDTVAPVIHPLNIRDGSNFSRARKIMFRMSDNLSGVKSYAGHIDGKWVLMVLDYKTKILSYTFDDDITAGKHIFELTVTDNKDNSSEFKANFYR
jgi:hypothetical protein